MLSFDELAHRRRVDAARHERVRVRRRGNGPRLIVRAARNGDERDRRAGALHQCFFSFFSFAFSAASFAGVSCCTATIEPSFAFTRISVMSVLLVLMSNDQTSFPCSFSSSALSTVPGALARAIFCAWARVSFGVSVLAKAMVARTTASVHPRIFFIRAIMQIGPERSINATRRA